MKFTSRLLLILFFFLFWLSVLRAQNGTIHSIWKVDTLIVAPQPHFTYVFPRNHFLIPATLQIFLNRHPLNETLDYRLEDKRRIVFFRTFRRQDSLRIVYQRYPFDFPRTFTLYRIDTSATKALKDSLSRHTRGVRLRAVRLENPFSRIPSTLQTSGSIMRGIQVGSNQDFTLNSGLNIQLAGKLSDDIEIIAALTDAATPIQPEGNTQTLQEIDKVYVTFKSPFLQGTVGDFNLAYDHGVFGRIHRKLQGLTLQSSFKKTTVGATIASTRGFFHHVAFMGQEGNQGPYQLTGKNGERDIIVLAGTERVFINGQRLTRGESNDYVIEYGSGQIRFTNQRLITSESRIEVDFEYFPALQSYNRSVYSAFANHTFTRGKLRLNVQYYREEDNTNQVLEESQSLTKAQKQILKQAGDDPFKATEPGFTFKGDSAGSYVKVDTIYAGNTYSIFKYVGKQAGNYSVSFSFFGRGKGDYVRDRLGVYRWVGPGQGEYLPIHLIPLPNRHQLIDFRLSGHPYQRLKFESEYALSNLDQNTLSPLEDGDNIGQAFRFSSVLSPAPITMLGMHWGKLGFNFRTRFIQKTFRAPDRFRPADFERYWNLYSAQTSGNQELSFLLNVRYLPRPSLHILGNAGQFYQEHFKSKRLGIKLNLENFHSLVSHNYYESISATNFSERIGDDWQRYGSDMQRKIWKVLPSLRYKGEWRKRTLRGFLSGFRYDDLGAGMAFPELRHFNAELLFDRRWDYVYDIQRAGTLLPQAQSNTFRFRFNLKDLKSTTFNFSLMHRTKNYTSFFETIKIDTLKQFYADAAVQDTSWRDRSTNLAQFNLTHQAYKKAIDFSWQYKLSTEETALREKVYVDVGEGRGNLRYDADLKEYVPDPLGNYVLYILPTGKFEPVSTVQTALRLRVDPYRYFRRQRKFRSYFWSKLSGETYLRVEEESRDPNKAAVYLLNPNHLQEKYTVRGVINFNQDLYYMRHNRRLSFRLRLRTTQNYNNQFVNSDENDRKKSRELGLRVNWRPMLKLRSQSEIRWRTYFRLSTANALRNRDILGYYLLQNFSYRPRSRWEFGWESESGYEKNRSLLYPLSLYFVLLKQRINYSLPTRGRMSALYQLQNVQVTANPFQRIVPFEMAKGKREGFSQEWQLRVEYTVAKNIVFTFSYIGRKDAGFQRIIHSGQAQLRAFL
jgi:hypothetical protein